MNRLNQTEPAIFDICRSLWFTKFIFHLITSNYSNREDVFRLSFNIVGLCCELYQSMYPVILVEYLTLPKLKSCLGFTILCHGLAVAGTFPVLGKL
jgi:hypothetical protein